MHDGTDADASGDPRVASILPVLTVGAFCVGVSMRAMDALLPRLSAEFDITLSEASQTITLFSVAYGIALLLIGPLGDRYGKLFIILCGCLLSIATSLACAISGDFGSLRVARLASGAAASALMTLAMAWVGDVIPYRHRQHVLARLLAGMSLGVTTGIFVGGLAADGVIHWRAIFGGLSVIFVILVIALFLLRSRLPRTPAETEGAGARSVGAGFLEYVRLLRNPWAIRILSIVFVEGAVFFGAVAFIPYHLHKSQGISLSAASSIVMLVGLGGLFFAARAARFVSAGEVRLVALGGALVGTALMVVGGSKAWPLAIPACFLAGLGMYMLHSTLQTNATQIAPGTRGAAMAAFSACFFLGQSTGVAITGQVVDRLGTTPVMFASACGMLVLGLTFSQMLRRISRPT